ncbi:hypothetical protein BANRA_05759 [Escherichia coli]|nr:hypothetical protein BANRA_05759 [Escherichia coli]
MLRKERFVSVSERKLYVLAAITAASGALLYGLMHLPSERYRSGSVSAPYPERTAGMAFQPS